MKNMKKYEAPSVLVISRGEMDVICTSLPDFELPIVPVEEEEETEEV
jgi:hypothetical protein